MHKHRLYITVAKQAREKEKKNISVGCYLLGGSSYVLISPLVVLKKRDKQPIIFNASNISPQYKNI